MNGFHSSGFVTCACVCESTDYDPTDLHATALRLILRCLIVLFIFSEKLENSFRPVSLQTAEELAAVMLVSSWPSDQSLLW